jgi:hypothetical protein
MRSYGIVGRRLANAARTAPVAVSASIVDIDPVPAAREVGDVIVRVSANAPASVPSALAAQMDRYDRRPLCFSSRGIAAGQLSQHYMNIRYGYATRGSDGTWAIVVARRCE